MNKHELKTYVNYIFDNSLDRETAYKYLKLKLNNNKHECKYETTKKIKKRM
jgi:hypothetical protein